MSVGAQSDLSAADFAAITSGLTRDRLPGVSGLVYAVPATDAEVPAVQAYWRGQGATDRRMPALSLAAGTVITLLLAGLVGILAGARNRAMAEVDAATAALRLDIERRRETEARLREREDQLRHSMYRAKTSGKGRSVLAQ